MTTKAHYSITKSSSGITWLLLETHGTMSTTFATGLTEEAGELIAHVLNQHVETIADLARRVPEIDGISELAEESEDG